jgi:hypothetical protein
MHQGCGIDHRWRWQCDIFRTQLRHYHGDRETHRPLRFQTDRTVNWRSGGTRGRSMPLAAGFVVHRCGANAGRSADRWENICGTVGQCDVLPISIDSSTPYTFNQTVTPTSDRSAPVTGRPGVGRQQGATRTNIANGSPGTAHGNRTMGGHRAESRSGRSTKASAIARRRLIVRTRPDLQ